MELEQQVGFTRGRGGSSQSCITVLNDLPPGQVQKKLRTEEQEHPKLIVFTIDGSKIDMIRITGEGHVIELDDMGMVEAVLLLCITYRVAEISFPRKYCQFLGMLTHRIFKENYPGKKSKKFLELIPGIGDDNSHSVVKKRKLKTDKNIDENIVGEEGEQPVISDSAGKQIEESPKGTEGNPAADAMNSGFDKNKRVRKPKVPVDM